MSSRKRSLRSNGSRNLRRSLPPLLESLEARLVLSTVSPIQRTVTGPITTTGGAPPVPVPVVPVGATPTLKNIQAVPQYRLKMIPGPNGVLIPDASPNPFQGYSPQQLQGAYGVNQINFGGGIMGTGAGQTIAVIDAGNNPGFLPSTSPNYSTSNLAIFDKTFGIDDPPSFGMYNETGGTTLPGAVAGWGPEIALDIEWAHAMAPDAKIDIVEGTSGSYADLFTAMDTAVTKLGASVVSMSFGGPLEFEGASSFEQTFDQTYFQPALAANPDVTFLASTGDSGADPGDAPNYPSVSPFVVAVGGTTLNLTKAGLWQSETGWSYGSDSYAPTNASGGGISTFYTEPVFQVPDQSTGFRTVPDVSSDADPSTGVSVYDPGDFGASTPFQVIGGTSLSSPTWAGLIAIADQGRVLNGLAPLSGPTQTLPALYGIPAADYHDITVGYNNYNAGPGYDLVTGRGTPITPKLIGDLVGYGAATKAVIAYEPPSTVSAGGVFGTVVEAEVASGNQAFGFTGSATISLVSGPSGTTFTPVTVSMTDGLGVVDGLTLNTASGTPYVFQIAVDAGKNLFATLTTTGVTVTPAAPSGTGVFYPLPVDASLRNDVSMADSNTNATNNLLLVYSADYEISQGTIVLQNTSPVGIKNLQFIGQGAANSVITANGLSRDFEILGLSNVRTNNLSILFQHLSIDGGKATDIGGLVLPTGAGVGGGVLMDGGLVTMSKVSFEGNSAAGRTGSTGFVGASVTGGPGGPGGIGGLGQGGAIYLAAGSLTLTNDVITGNTASGGKGGAGGTGGLGGTLTQFGSFYFPHRIPGGVGGTGGQGGSGQGGGLFVNGGHVSITSGTITGNVAKGGTGGDGGLGGTGGTFNFPGGQGGLGGPGGGGAGGGIYLFSGSVSLNSTNLSANHGQGGTGGKGGTGGFGGREITTAGGTFTGRGGQGGDGGKGGLGFGGGMYILNGTVSFGMTAVTGSDSSGGKGGSGGVVGVGAKGNHDGGGGPSGTGAGGGIFDAAAALTLTGASISNNKADTGGGINIKGALTLEQSTVSDNVATNGGGINITGTLVLQDTDLTGNAASNNGGGVNSNGNFTITGGEFDDNSASLLGGAIDSSGKGSITGTEFDGNDAQAGGAVFAVKNGTLTINSGTSFDSNVAQEGGAIESQGALTVTTGVAFSGNMASGGTGNGGAIYNNQGKATIAGDTFTNNAGTNGGAIESITGPITITSSSFTGNQASGGTGGAIGGTGTITVVGGSFSSNSAASGGAIGASGTITVTGGATISDNTAAGGQGGGIYSVGSLSVNSATAITGNSALAGGGIWSDGNLSLGDVTIANNSAAKTGGGVYNSSGSVGVTGASITGNHAGAGGGGIYINQGALTVGNTTLSQNTAGGAGGAIDDVLSKLALTSLTVSQNTAGGFGGGVYNSGKLTVSIVTFSGNSGSSGGGLYDATTGNGTVTDATFNLNKALTGSGGGIYTAGQLTFTNATIAQNSAVFGAGIYNALGPLTTVNATIAENTASAAGKGGGLYNAGGIVSIYNTIIASNVRGSSTPDDIFPLTAGTVSLNSSNNLLGIGATGVLSAGSNGNQVGVANAHLGNLTNNGGPLATIALLTGSTAIDGGANSIPGVVVPTYDERGAARGPGGLHAGPNVDIGAYEASSSYLVTNTVDAAGYGSILSAVDWANISFNDNPANLAPNVPAPNTVTFDSANVFSSPQTVTLLVPLEFKNTTTGEAIQGTGVNSLTISGGNSVQLFKVDAGVNVDLGGLTLTGGSAISGGAVDNFGILTVSGAMLEGNSATTLGGSIRNESNATLMVSNSTLSGDSAAQGGAIYNNGMLTINGSTLSNNNSGQGGAVENSGTLMLQNSTFSSNSSTGSAGAIGNAATGNATVIGSTFSNDAASGVSGQGGAINSAGALTITQSSFTSNTAAGSGGAVYNSSVSTPLSVVDSVFTGNQASAGGAIFTATAATLTGSTLSANSATSGGAIDDAGSLTATNTTLASNTATTGGALYSMGTLTLVNTTIAYNQAATIGGGLEVTGGTATLYNTLIAQNTAGSPSSPSDVGGTLSSSSSNNLIASTFAAGGLSSASNGNLIGANAGLAPALADNGGPTQTIALLAGSAAIDAGDNTIAGISVPTVDQRGALRGAIVNGGLNAGSSVDIGAYEASSSYVVSTSTDALTTGTLRTGVDWADISTNANPANILNPAPNSLIFSTTGTITLTGGALSLSNNGGTAVAKSILGPGASKLSISGGDAGGVFTVGSGVTASITGLTITDGLASSAGGAIDNSGTLSLANLAISGNSANSGGGIANEPTGNLSIAFTSFANNSATTFGGGIFNMNTLSLTSDSFTGNSALIGAGVENSAGANLTITESTLSSNSASLSGGGLDNTGTLTLSNSTLMNNTAGTGGGFNQESSGAATLTDATITLNTATSGGGIAAAGPVTIINATIADNTSTAASGGGGGIYLTTGGKAALYNSIVAQNFTGGGQFAPASDISLSGGGSLVPNSSFNLIGTGGSGGLTSGGNTGNLVGVANVGLASSPQFNGGPTETLALLAGSPAMDKGAATIVGVAVPSIDQRGALRGPAGLDAGPAPDVGAFEASSSYLVSTTADTNDVGTILTAVDWANHNSNTNPEYAANLAPNTIAFDQKGVFSTPQTITVTGAPLALSHTRTAEAVTGPVTGTLSFSGGNSSGVFTVGAGVTATLTGLTISGGSAAQGGAIDNSGTLNLINDTVSGNSAATGGAIANEAGGTLSILDSTLASNTATTAGGSIANAGTATVTDSTIANSTAPLGAAIENTGKLTMINDTVAYNTATQSGGGAGLAVVSGTVTVFNSIIAQNTDGTGPGAALDDISGLLSSNSANNVIDSTNSAGGLANATNGNVVGVAAGLAAGLADNGGSTQTIALLPGSPALSAGTTTIPGYTIPNTDQRGTLRNPTNLNNGTTNDAGSYEVSSSYLVTSTGDALVAGTLRSAIAWADNNPSSAAFGPNVIMFDPTVFSTPQTINLSDSLGTLEFTSTSVPVIIDGPGASLLTISGDGTFGLLSIPTGGAASLTGLTMSDGGAQSGGAILNQGSLAVSDSVFSNDSAIFYGGAIFNNGGSLTVSYTTFTNNRTFTNNQATYGLGAAIDNTGTLKVLSSTFTGGAAFEGGAIANESGVLNVTSSTFNKNTAIQGGGLYNNASATIIGSTISNNTAFQGGGIANDLIASLTLLNSTIAGNAAGQNGGGINQVGTLFSVSSTIANNTVAAGGAGGGIDASSGTTTLYNTLIAGNTAVTGTTTTTSASASTGTGTGTGTGTSTGTSTSTTASISDVAGTIAKASANNLIGGTATGITNGVNGNLVGVNKPLIGKLANNGGPTETVALLAGSPAIDAGASSFVVASGTITAPALDERGAVRGSTGVTPGTANAGTTVDIGAYEASSLYEVTSSADTTDPGTLRAAISWADANQNFNPTNVKTPVANTIVFTTTTPIKLTGGALVLSNTTTPISIIGPANTAQLVVNAAGASQVFQITAGTTVSISNLTITGGVAVATNGQTGSGGDIDNFGTLNLTNDTITGGSAINGGGLANEAKARATITGSTISSNSGTTGGGIYNAGTMSLLDSTVAGNFATSEGAGVANFGTLTAVSSTIALNNVAAGGAGGGLENIGGTVSDIFGGTVSLFDTIVAQNTAGSTNPATYSDIGGTVSASSAFNMIGSAGSGGLTAANSNLIVSDSSAGLGALAANGGATQTIALSTGSPAIGAGSSTITGVTVPATDERGGVRPTSSSIDIGAYQSGAFTPAPAIVTAPQTGPQTIKTITTPAVITPPVTSTPVVTPVVSTPLITSTSVVKQTARKLKVTAKKTHPGAGSANKFHKTAIKKAAHHAIAKAHTAAHAKKK